MFLYLRRLDPVTSVAVQAPAVTPDLVAQRAVLDTEDGFGRSRSSCEAGVLERRAGEGLAVDRPDR